MNPNRSIVALAATVAFVSCKNDTVEVYRIPKDNVQVALQTPSGGFGPNASPQAPEWKTPEGWREQPRSDLRAASFRIDGPDRRSADVSIIAFPGEAGGVTSNVNRWRSQVQLPPLPEDKLQPTIHLTEVEGIPTYFVDVHTPQIVTKPSRILGAILETPESTWFVKMTGDPALVEREQEKFVAFVQSFRFGSGTLSALQTARAVNTPQSTNDQ
jgi:hypothetical protein